MIRRPRHPDAIGVIAIVVVGVIVLYGGVTTPDPGFGVVNPATFPIIIGILMLVSAAWLLLQTRGATMPQLEAIDRTPFSASLVATLLFLIAFVPLGFVVSAVPFFVAEARILGSRSLIRDAIACVVFVGLIYLLFVLVLKIDLPKGPLPF